MSDIKKELYQKCIEFSQTQIESIEQAIKSAEQSATDDTKSSAGDKYETGREMMSQEIKRLSGQLQEAKKLIEAINRFTLIEKSNGTIRPGSLVFTDNGNFYISIGIGQIKLEDEVYYAISQASPLALKLIGLKAGTSAGFNNRLYQIKKVI